MRITLTALRRRYRPFAVASGKGSDRPRSRHPRDGDRTALSVPEADMLTIERLLVDAEWRPADNGRA